MEPETKQDEVTLIETAWGLIANCETFLCPSSERTHQQQEWVAAAERWRNRYHKHLDEVRQRPRTRLNPDGQNGWWELAFDIENYLGLTDSGLLWFLNRVAMHPNGLALAPLLEEETGKIYGLSVLTAPRGEIISFDEQQDRKKYLAWQKFVNELGQISDGVTPTEGTQ